MTKEQPVDMLAGWIQQMTQRKVSTEELGILRVREDRDRLINHCKDQ